MGHGAWGMVYYSAGVGTCACTLRRHAPCPLPHAIKRCTVLSMRKYQLLAIINRRDATNPLVSS